MRNIILICVVSCILFPIKAGAQDDSEYKDTPYFSGMPNYIVSEAEDIEFDSYTFYNGKDCTTVEGKKFKRTYALKEDAKKASNIQISRNYGNAVKNMGGTVLYEGEPQEAECSENNGRYMMIGKVVKDGNELWVEVLPGDGYEYYMTVALKELMKQDVTANDMFDTLNRDGRIALYINFDTGKSIIKPESKPIIEQIVQMMKANPSLAISVEGHTDNVGSEASNKKLSDDRARAVLTEIVSQGIDTKRLTSIGYGQEKPVVDNNTEEGRAKNRRVELVKK